MKRLILIILVCVSLGSVANAQTYTTNPPSFTAEDNVTITVDVTGTSLANYAGDVWMWAWISEGCSSGCDAPTNVDPAGAAAANALMTRVSANVYRITFKPTEFYNRAPSEIKKIGFKLKSISWNDGKQSDNDIIISVEPLVFTPKVNRIFPTKVTNNDVVTLYLDQSVATNLDLKYQTGNFTVDITAYDAEGDEVGTAIENRTLVNSGNGLHYVRILPTYTFGSSEVATLKYKFKSVSNNELESEEFELVFFN